MHTILAIDDEASIRASYSVMFGEDYRLLLAESGEEGLSILDNKHVDLVLLDLRMRGMNGDEVLRKLQERGSSVPVVVVTANDMLSSAVEMMRLGAADYVVKPFDVDATLKIVQRLLDETRDRRELATLREADRNGFDSIIGSSPALMDVFQKARQAMQVDSTVLITGENGTGKDLIARAIHTGGARSERAFVPLSCCAIPAQLIESELFGYEKGAFTGADERRIGKLQVADEGTLFLDEIGEMPVEAQVKLLRVLQDSCFFPVGSVKEIRVNIRVISATNRNLMEGIEQGIFREDLFYRLNVLHIEMPPLRERRQDIPDLVAHFMVKHAPRVNAQTKEITPQAMARLANHRWPGNVRELGNSMERLLVYFGQEDAITADHVATLFPQSAQASGVAEGDFSGMTLDEATGKVERRLIEEALDECSFVISRAAERLGTTRRILKYKMDQHEIEGAVTD